LSGPKEAVEILCHAQHDRRFLNTLTYGWQIQVLKAVAKIGGRRNLLQLEASRPALVAKAEGGKEGSAEGAVAMPASNRPTAKQHNGLSYYALGADLVANRG
jgi:hypothetical protein